MAKVTVVGWVTPPPVLVTVMVRVPRAALLLTLIPIVDDPVQGAAIGLGTERDGHAAALTGSRQGDRRILRHRRTLDELRLFPGGFLE
jgi:hypothetical protein